MTHTWTIQTGGSEADLMITGTTLEDAIRTAPWETLSRALSMDNAAGYRLVSVQLIPAGRAVQRWMETSGTMRTRDLGAKTTLRVVARPYRLDTLEEPIQRQVTIIGPSGPEEPVDIPLSRGGRPPVGPQITLRIPEELLDRVDARAAELGITRSELLRRGAELALTA